MRMRWFVVAALVPILAGCPDPGPDRVERPETAEEGEVPIRFGGPGGAALIIPVYVNGEGPFDFVLDTGATLTCIDRALIERLGLPEQRRAAVGAGVEGVSRVALVSVDSLRVGAAQGHGLTACELDMEHIQALRIHVDGLLGLNFLREFRLTLDFPGEVARFE
jgi:predicted aspartyl protease